MTLQWVAASLRTGAVIADLPTFVPSWPIRRTLSQYDTADGALYLDRAPLNWQEATEEGGALLACYDDDDPDERIQWAGFVSEANVNTDTESVDCSLVTVEGWLDRIYVGDEDFTGHGQLETFAALITNYAADTDDQPGIPIAVSIVGVTAGGPDDVKLADAVWQNADNVTVYGRLNGLTALASGIEWRIDWQWTDDGSALTAVAYAGNRLGAVAPADGFPPAVFEMPGLVTNATYSRSYADGMGATDVQAYSDGQGNNAAPYSAPVKVSDYRGRPRFEKRFAPAASVTSQAQLDRWAQRAGALLGPGIKTLTLEAILADTTRHGGTWTIGDDIGYRLGGLDDNGVDYVKAFPGGVSGTARALAYDLGEATISPILAVPTIDGSEATAG